MKRPPLFIHLSEGSMPFKAVLFFICHPDAKLSTPEMAEVLGCQPNYVAEFLRYAVRNGLIASSKGPSANGRRANVYAPGEALSKMLATAMSHQPQRLAA
jgi:hypothetical protein